MNYSRSPWKANTQILFNGRQAIINDIAPSEGDVKTGMKEERNGSKNRDQTLQNMKFIKP
jgi:hypothetical protein